MANSLTVSPWFIDTPTLTDLVGGQRVVIKSIRWFGATTAGHQCRIVDNDSNTIWESRASGANYVEAEQLDEEYPPPKRGPGLRAAALESGTVLIYYR